jgi:hypothetical protein
MATSRSSGVRRSVSPTGLLVRIGDLHLSLRDEPWPGAGDARSHDHQEHTEIDYALEYAARAAVEPDGERLAVGPGGAVLIPSGMRHRAPGQMTIPDVVVPPFDPADESFD